VRVHVCVRGCVLCVCIIIIIIMIMMMMMMIIIIIIIIIIAIPFILEVLDIETSLHQKT